MKIIILFTLFCLIFEASAVAPYGIKGQNQSTLYSNVHQFPNNQVTNLGGINALVETGNNNILQDASFEGGNTTNVWVSTGSFVSDNTPVHGQKNALVTLSAQSLDIYQNSTLYASQFADGVPGLAYARVRTSITSTPIYVCPRNAGAYPSSLTSGCTAVNPNGKWGLYKVPFTLGATSNGIGVTSNAVSISSGDVEIDDAFVGAVDLKADSVQIQTQTTKFTAGSTGAGVTISGTPTTTGSGNFTVSSGTITALRDINIVFVCTATNSAGAAVSPQIYANGATTGHASSPAATASQSTTTSWSGILLSGQNANCVNGTNTASSGQVSVLSWNTTNTQLYSASCGANCEDVLSAKVSSGGVVSAENVDWISGNCTSTSPYTCTFNSNLFTQAPNCIALMGDNSAVRIARTNSVSSSSVVIGMTDTASSQNAPFTLFCQKQGTDFTASRSIIGTFNEMMTAPGITKPKTCYYTFGGAASTLASPVNCTTGTCVEVSDSCGSFTPPARTGTGVYENITIANGTFANSSLIDCKCNAFDTANVSKDCRFYSVSSDQTWSTTASGGYVGNIFTNVPAAAAADTYVQVKCEGQAP